MKTEGKKKQVAQNTVEYDGIKLQYYNQSLEKNYPYRKKKKFKDAAFGSSGGLPPCFGALLIWGKQAGVTKAEYCLL